MKGALLVLESSWPGAGPDRLVYDYMTTRLFAMGLDLVGFSRVRAVPGLAEPLIESLFHETEYLVVVGGLAPGGEFSLKTCLTDMFGVDFHPHPGLRERINKYYADGWAADQLEDLSLMPRSSLLLTNRFGPVAGFFVEVDDVYLLALPYSHRVMEAMLEEQVSPLMETMEFGRGEYRRSMLLRVAGSRSAGIESALQSVDRQVAGMTHSLMELEGEVLLRLSAVAPTEGETELALMEGREMLRAELGGAIYGVGSATLERVVSEALSYGGQRLSVLDGATSGLLAHLLARQPRASEFLAEVRVETAGASGDTGSFASRVAALAGGRGLALGVGRVSDSADAGARVVLARDGAVVVDAEVGSGGPRQIAYMALDTLRSHLGWEGGA